MELKYYLRGLGLGIAITAVIMGIAASKNRTMTNEEIIARAKQLGMTEENAVLTEINSDKEDNGQDADELGEPETESLRTGEEVEGSDETGAGDSDMTADTGNSASEDGEGVPDTVIANSEEDAETTSLSNDEIVALRDSAKTTDTGTDAEAGEPDSEVSERNRTVSSDPMVITIGRGDGSYSVSKKLADVGAVASAKDFDTYLCQNGYDKRIRSGTYTIPADASDEQMAKIITGIE